VVEVSNVALSVHDNTTDDAMRPVLMERFAIRCISESCTSKNIRFNANVINVISNAKALFLNLVSRGVIPKSIRSV
jgi:hypothetical protein